MIRTILVPVQGDGTGENAIAHASVLARRHQAHIDVAHCRPRPEDMLPHGLRMPDFLKRNVIDQARDVADAEEAALRGHYDRIIGDLHLNETTPSGTQGPTARWVEETAKQADMMKHRGRLADLIVVSKPDRDENLGTNVLMSALFLSARPVLMCPTADEAPATLGDTITIAWNGSLEAARAVAMTLDLIQAAKNVTILTAGEGEAHGASAEELIAYLALRGVPAKQEKFEARGRAGRAVLRRSAEMGADMMIMGAYSESHEREAIFGGNTQSVVDEAMVPVVMVH